MRDEYKREDLGKGVRGKYHQAYQNGTNIVRLDADIAKHFKDSESVNRALRSLIGQAGESSAPVTS
ncbi:hypothetical protein VSS37_13395 [Candidatus Thiothrix sp. Deng01]|uniref:Uncharacterized protein n=1 Tax=Candidatus Thiothrix phosphatis TaxID=3112415 RepID=A0ABU6D0V2_9GAMM|nr:hypothetical protein [Candidatus Thiothrix sp. Deng01]MEB4591982.1 hypothetical protein [Candidatus Thiothrix sp. Deng01]